MYGRVKIRVREILKELAKRKGVEIVEGKVMNDHVHMALSIAPKYSVSSVLGYLKGKSAILLHQENEKEYRKNYWQKNFWARGYYVSTIGLDEKKVREYIQKQEYIERRMDRQTEMGLL